MNKFSLTERMSAAIKLTHEFCEAMKIPLNTGYEFEMMETDEQTVNVNVEILNLPKPNYLFFVLHHCLTGWKVWCEGLIKLSLPSDKELSEKILELDQLEAGENNFILRYLHTRCGEETITFDKVY